MRAIRATVLGGVSGCDLGGVYRGVLFGVVDRDMPGQLVSWLGGAS